MRERQGQVELDAAAWSARSDAVVAAWRTTLPSLTAEIALGMCHPHSTVTACLPLSPASSACQGQQGPDAPSVCGPRTRCALRAGGALTPAEKAKQLELSPRKPYISVSIRVLAGQGRGAGGNHVRRAIWGECGRKGRCITSKKKQILGQTVLHCPGSIHKRRRGHVRGAGGDGDTYEAVGGREGGRSSSLVAFRRCARAAHQGSTGGNARAEPTKDKPVRRRVCAAWRRGCPEREEAASAQKSDAAPPTLVTLVGRKRVRARCTGECRPQHDKGAQIVWKRDVPALPGRRPGAGRHAA